MPSSGPVTGASPASAPALIALHEVRRARGVAQHDDLDAVQLAGELAADAAASRSPARRGRPAPRAGAVGVLVEHFLGLDRHDLGAGDDVHARALQRAQQVPARDRLDAEADALAHLEDRHRRRRGRRAARRSRSPVALPPTTTTSSSAARPQLVRAGSAWASCTMRGADAGDRRDQRLGAGGDHDHVGRLRRDRLRRDLGVRGGSRRRAPSSRRAWKSRKRSTSRLLGARPATSSLPPSWSSRSQIETSCPRSARDPRRLHARRAAADDHHAPRRGSRRSDAPRQLAPGLGVDRAAARPRRGRRGPRTRCRRCTGAARPAGRARPCAASPARRSARGRAGRGRRRRRRSRRRPARGRRAARPRSPARRRRP